MNLYTKRGAHLCLLFLKAAGQDFGCACFPSACFWNKACNSSAITHSGVCWPEGTDLFQQRKHRHMSELTLLTEPKEQTEQKSPNQNKQGALVSTGCHRQASLPVEELAHSNRKHHSCPCKSSIPSGHLRGCVLLRNYSNLNRCCACELKWGLQLQC